MIDMNATQAAIRAGYSEHTAEQQGSRLLSYAKVAAAVQAAQAELRERTKVSVDSVTEQLDTAYEQAKDNGQPSAMVQATMGKAKVNCLLVDKTEDVTKPAQDMTPAELAAEMKRMQTELIGLMSPDELQIERTRVTAELRQIEALQRDKAGDSLH